MRQFTKDGHLLTLRPHDSRLHKQGVIAVLVLGITMSDYTINTMYYIYIYYLKLYFYLYYYLNYCLNDYFN